MPRLTLDVHASHASQIPVLKYPKILLTGGAGQVGGALKCRLSSLGKVWAPTRSEFDLADPESLSDKIQDYRPDLIINTAAYTAVDQAESEINLAHIINAESPRIFADEAKKLHIPLIHYSTDYVFDGTKREPYTEEDSAKPLSVYGTTKFAGEKSIQDTYSNHLIFRTSWVYSRKGRNFLTTMIRLFQEREEISIIDDQFGAPTSAIMLAEATIKILEQLRMKKEDEIRWGLYNLTPTGSTSWYRFALEILKEVKRDSQISPNLVIKSIHPIPTSEYPTPAKRPMNSRLDVSKIIREFQIELPSWLNTIKDC